MKRCLGLLCLVGLLTGGCDGILSPESHGCPQQQRTETTEQESPNVFSRARAFVDNATILLGGGQPQEALLTVQQIETMEALDEGGCSGYEAGHQAEVVVLLEAGEDLSVRLPASLWLSDDEAAGASIGFGVVGAFDASMRVPYEPYDAWPITGIRARGGCDEPVVIEVRITRNTCSDIENCADTSFVEVATMELESPWCEAWS